jgi:hypothetical protein
MDLVTLPRLSPVPPTLISHQDFKFLSARGSKFDGDTSLLEPLVVGQPDSPSTLECRIKLNSGIVTSRSSSSSSGSVNFNRADKTHLTRAKSHDMLMRWGGGGDGSGGSEDCRHDNRYTELHSTLNSAPNAARPKPSPRLNPPMC